MRVTVVGMVYKSLSYLDFMLEQIWDYCLDSEHDVDYLIIANDATTEVLDALEGYKHVVYNDPKPDDYYLNRVYRAWNFGAEKAPGDVIVFVNSDMAFSEDWLDNLLKHLRPDTIPVSRLVESGKLRSGRYGMEKSFGKTPEKFRRWGFDPFVKKMSRNETKKGGLYMPCAFHKEEFLAAGGYPEGNIYEEGIGQHGGRFVKSGDDYFFHDVMKDKKHLTVFDSIVYHIQEGELDA